MSSPVSEMIVFPDSGETVFVTERLRRIAAAYPADAVSTPKAERERYFTAEQHAAWSLRFAAPLHAIEVIV